jgi:hypothetical protein
MHALLLITAGARSRLSVPTRQYRIARDGLYVGINIPEVERAANSGGLFVFPHKPHCVGMCRCPLWVKSRHMRRNKSCPLYSQLRLQKRIFALRHVRFTPESRHVQCGSACLLWAISGLMQCSKKVRYSITSSAICWRCTGTVRPRVLAVLRLSTNSNLVGCSTGRSAGFVPLSIFPAYTPACRLAAVRLGP